MSRILPEPKRRLTGCFGTSQNTSPSSYVHGPILRPNTGRWPSLYQKISLSCFQLRVTDRFSDTVLRPWVRSLIPDLVCLRCLDHPSFSHARLTHTDPGLGTTWNNQRFLRSRGVRGSDLVGCRTAVLYFGWAEEKNGGSDSLLKVVV